MKNWKVDFANHLMDSHKEYIVIPFKSVMDELEISHVARQDAEDIIRYVLKNSKREIGFMHCAGEPLVNGFFTTGKTGIVKINRIELNLLNAMF